MRLTTSMTPYLLLFLFAFLTPHHVIVAGDVFKSLECVNIVIEALSSDEASVNLIDENLKDTIFVKLKAKLPNLRVSNECSSDNFYQNLESIYVAVTLTPERTADGNAIGFSGVVTLALRRPVRIINADGEMVIASVWSTSSLVGGPMDSAKTLVYESLDEQLTKFAALYLKAGNYPAT